jgi:D-alanyl-D-alanine carboxypeptidase/D-alanyl-D-alanine-endopeptidase (penicillin-binding protein 4)
MFVHCLETTDETIMNSRRLINLISLLAGMLLVGTSIAAEPLPHDLRSVLDKPRYKNSVWGLKVIDLDSGDVLYEMRPDQKRLTGSVRKLFSVGLALKELGPEHKFVTPIYRRGEIKNGVLQGDLILVASGDLAMGGRTNPDGSLAVADYDHNEANSLGNAELTPPDPLAGYKQLARQVAALGIKEVAGDVIVDTRLFEPFDFRGELNVQPIFVNDDVVDVVIDAGAKVDWRPKSAAFRVESALKLADAGTEFGVALQPECPQCFGAIDCLGKVTGTLPRDFVPPLTDTYPLVRTFRITEPQNYARTVFIEALETAGVKVVAESVGKNDASTLPAVDSYVADAKVAELVSQPYHEYAKWILKVSYNIGADTSLVLFGLTQGARSMTDSLAAERKMLIADFDIAGEAFQFVDGAGSGESLATPTAVVNFLHAMRKESFFNEFRDALPALASDGSLAFVTDFMKDSSLAGAKGNVHAKTGTLIVGSDDGTLSLRAQSLAGYIQTKSGRRLAYALFVNDVSPVSGLDEVIQVFQDEGTISAIIWRDN